MKNTGIYLIACLANGMIYIGSAKRLRARIHLHVLDLNGHRHCNPRLLQDWLRYGPEQFRAGVIEFCSAEQLIAREQYWLDRVRPFYDRGYNHLKRAYSSLGFKHSEPTIHRMRQVQKQNWAQHPEWKQQHSKRMKAWRKHNPSNIQGLLAHNAANVGVPRPESVKQKLRDVSEEVRQARRDRAKAQWANPKMAATMKHNMKGSKDHYLAR